MKNKYNATKQELDGYNFASKLEASTYTLLKARQNAGEIQILQCQDHIYLTDAEIHYIPDFKCLDMKTGETFWVESKGFESPLWPTKKKLWKFYGPGKLEVWKGHHARPYLDEVIIPKGRKG